jgi:shikimate kinase
MSSSEVELGAPLRIVVTGAAGSGKSTVALAQCLDVPFIEGDALHS